VRALAAILTLTLVQVPAAPPVQGPAALPPSTDQLFALFGTYLESLRTQAGIPGLAAAIVDSNGVAWEQAFGEMDVARQAVTRTDTPFHLDGLTQVFAATLVLQCVEEGRLTLDTPIKTFNASSPDANATVGQILTHTSGDPNNPTFSYHPERYNVLASVVATCTGKSFRVAVANMLDRSAMFDSVPGPDAPSDPQLPANVARYRMVLNRLAAPYSVDGQGRATPSQYPAGTLTPSGGLISTVLNYAQFDRGLRVGYILRSDTLAAAWRTPNGSPHGYGWFVQNYNGDQVVWQFGMGANASSSLVVTLPGRGITLIMLANSDGLAKPASLAGGDITVSPFARMFFQVMVK
jgi:CubicO group peptidase (beta-lactamase class C family)